MQLFLATLILNSIAFGFQQLPPLPTAPTDPLHPGSKVYTYGVSEQQITCNNRQISVFVPTSNLPGEKFPVVIYGHGQALDVTHYRGTFQHLAQKGVATILPSYDSGFFDQDWARMAGDFASLAQCAMGQFPTIDSMQVIFSGHSKGAYVASMAASMASAPRPQIVVLFESAGVDEASLAKMDPKISLTVVFADQDKTVAKSISDSLYSVSPSAKKQYIKLKSYTTQTSTPLTADHFWPQTAGAFFGGGPESSFHYFGEWKWLVAAAMDLKTGGKLDNPYLFGAEATEKGIPGFTDDVVRNF